LPTFLITADTERMRQRRTLQSHCSKRPRRALGCRIKDAFPV
jgi:hypothetical protein